jgi:multiple sugar transport system ATP-binding protein
LFGKHNITLTEGKGKKVEAAGMVGKVVSLGIRPEDIHDEPQYLDQMADDVVDAKIEVTELLGAEIYLYMEIDGANATTTARVNPRSKAKPGDVIKVALDPNKIQIFDKETEKVISN